MLDAYLHCNMFCMFWMSKLCFAQVVRHSICAAFSMSNSLSKFHRSHIQSAMEGWERIAVACSFVTSIACPLKWFCTPEDKHKLFQELDLRRGNYYHGLHMSIAHAWVRFLQRFIRHGFTVRMWRIIERWDPELSDDSDKPFEFEWLCHGLLDMEFKKYCFGSGIAEDASFELTLLCKELLHLRLKEYCFLSCRWNPKCLLEKKRTCSCSSIGEFCNAQVVYVCEVLKIIFPWSSRRTCR